MIPAMKLQFLLSKVWLKSWKFIHIILFFLFRFSISNPGTGFYVEITVRFINAAQRLLPVNLSHPFDLKKVAPSVLNSFNVRKYCPTPIPDYYILSYQTRKVGWFSYWCVYVFKNKNKIIKTLEWKIGTTFHQIHLRQWLDCRMNQILVDKVGFFFCSFFFFCYCFCVCVVVFWGVIFIYKTCHFDYIHLKNFY